MSSDLRHIKVNDQEVGLIGLEKSFNEVKRSSFTSPLQVMAELLRLARCNNYIPVSAEHEYCEAIYREYRRFLGEAVGQDRAVLEVKVLGPGCSRCDELEKRVRNAVAELELAADIRHVRNLKEISEYGPFPTPGLVLNGKMVSAGKVPSLDKLKKLLGGDHDSG